MEGVKALARSEEDLLNPQKCSQIIRSYKPLAVINAAAYTDVDKAEDEEETATLINGTAPGAMSNACFDLGIPFVQISTDYVFNGKGNTKWETYDKPDPQNAYGRSKLKGEQAVINSGANYAIIRTWIVSSNGKKIFLKQF